MMIKVLFFIPSLAGGGAERVLVNLVNNMSSSQFDITILTLFDTATNKKYLNSNIKYNYIYKNQFRGNIYYLKLFSPEFLARKFIEEDYDIAVSYLQGPTTRIISGIQNNSTKKIHWIHSETTRKNLLPSYRNFKEYIKSYKKFDSTVFVSETTKLAFEKTTNLNKAHIVKYNTVETDKIKENSKVKINDTLFDENYTNLITVGRLTGQKGYDRLLPIVNDLVSKNKNIRLYILGEGYLEQNIKEYIKDNELGEYIIMLGYKDNPYKYVRAADLFVCSSYTEGFSTAVTESLIVGTPVITTRVSGMEEMLGINNEYGLIVENNTNSLYEGLKYIISNKKLLKHYSDRAAERSSFFDTKKTVTEIEELFTSIYYNS